MKLSAILEPLIAAGVPGHVLLATVRAFEGEQSDALNRRRESDARRQAEKRERAKKSRDITLRHSDSLLATRAEDSSSTKEISRQEEKKKTPRDELAAVLDHERATAVVEHRQKIRKPLTAYAAKQLAAKLSQAPDPNTAADLMIEKGWQSFELGWLESRAPQPRATAPPAGKNFNDILDNLQGKTPHDAQSATTIDAGDYRTDRGGAPNLVQLHALPARGGR